MPPDTPKYFQILRNIFRYSQMLPDAPRCSQMFQNIPRCSRIIRDTPTISKLCELESNRAQNAPAPAPPKKNTILGERETQMSGPSLVYFNRVEKRRWKKHLSTTSYLGKFSRPVGDDCCGSPLLVRNASETRPKRARTHPKRVRTRPKRA